MILPSNRASVRASSFLRYPAVTTSPTSASSKAEHIAASSAPGFGWVLRDRCSAGISVSLANASAAAPALLQIASTILNPELSWLEVARSARRFEPWCDVRTATFRVTRAPLIIHRERGGQAAGSVITDLSYLSGRLAVRQRFDGIGRETGAVAQRSDIDMTHLPGDSASSAKTDEECLMVHPVDGFVTIPQSSPRLW